MLYRSLELPLTKWMSSTIESNIESKHFKAFLRKKDIDRQSHLHKGFGYLVFCFHPYSASRVPRFCMACTSNGFWRVSPSFILAYRACWKSCSIEERHFYKVPQLPTGETFLNSQFAAAPALLWREKRFCFSTQCLSCQGTSGKTNVYCLSRVCLWENLDRLKELVSICT